MATYDPRNADQHQKPVSDDDHSETRSPEPETNQKDERNLKISKILRTVTLVSSWAAMGLCTSLIGPTQLDLQERLGCDTTFEQMSRALSTKNIGTIVGSSSYAVLHDRFRSYSDVFFATSMFFYGFAVLLKPWANEIWLLATLYFIEGLGHGSQNVGGNAVIMMTWGKDGNAPMHALHFGFGIGAVFGPILASPFLSSDSLCEDKTQNTSTENTTVYPTTEHVEDVSNVEIAYAIASLFPFTLCVVFLASFLVKPPKNFIAQGGAAESLRDVFSPGRCAGGATGFAIAVLALIGVFYLLFGGISLMMGNYIFTYAVESDLGFDKEEAALMNSAYFFAFMVGRGLSVPISHFVSIVPLLFSEVYIFALVTGCLAFLGTQDKTYFWIFVCLYSAFDSVIYPAGITWLDKYLILMSVMIAIIDITTNVGAIVFVNSAGYIFTYKNPNDMLYLAFAINVFLCLWLVVMQAVAARRGSRYVSHDVIDLTTDVKRDAIEPTCNDTVKEEMTESSYADGVVNHHVSEFTEITQL